MSAEPQTQSPTHGVDIVVVRAEIDLIDAQLASLVARRAGFARDIAAAKRAEGDTGFGWRPAREVEIMRTLLARQQGLDPGVMATIWRALISANLAMQGDLQIACTARSAAAARTAFGLSATSQSLPSSMDVLKTCRDQARTIGVLPWPNGQDRWWSGLLEDPDLGGVYVCAASPGLAQPAPPEAVLLAHRKPEAATDDWSLVAGPVDALSPFGGDILDQNGDTALIRVSGFIHPDEPQAQGVRLIGTYALA